MVRQLRCERCGRLHSATGVFSDDPDVCRACGYEEFEVLGDDDDDISNNWGRYFNIDAFVMMSMGIAVLNIMAGVLGGFGSNYLMMSSAGVSFVTLLVVAYFISGRSRPAWTAAFAVYLLMLVGGLLTVVLGYTIMSGSPIMVPPENPDNYTVGGFLSDMGNPLTLVYAGIYVLLGLLGLAFLVGGRDEIE